MKEDRVSITALLTTYARAYHATHDTPKIFDDFLAGQFLSEKERAWFGVKLVEALPLFNPELGASHPDPTTALAWMMKNRNAPTTISRARYAEDALVAAINSGVQQYILLGAGMDTFAFRRPEMMKRLAVFEVDHPATQAFKRKRLAELQWELPPRLHFIPVDLAKDSLVAALQRSPHDPLQASFVSWLGVTYYLTRDAVLNGDLPFHSAPQVCSFSQTSNSPLPGGFCSYPCLCFRSSLLIARRCNRRTWSRTSVSPLIWHRGSNCSNT